MPSKPFETLKKYFWNLIQITKKAHSNGKLLIFLGAILILTSAAWRVHKSQILSFNADYGELTVNEEHVQKLNPPIVSISLPKLKMNLQVEEATIKDGTWQILENKVAHLDLSANPGEGGNVVMYGHNKRSLFGPIRWLYVGDLIELTTEDGTKHTYQISQTFETTPDGIEHILPKSEETVKPGKTTFAPSR
jgi:sortase (surface protein transpeptidase)